MRPAAPAQPPTVLQALARRGPSPQTPSETTGESPCLARRGSAKRGNVSEHLMSPILQPRARLPLGAGAVPCPSRNGGRLCSACRLGPAGCLPRGSGAGKAERVPGRCHQFGGKWRHEDTAGSEEDVTRALMLWIISAEPLALRLPETLYSRNIHFQVLRCRRLTFPHEKG